MRLVHPIGGAPICARCLEARGHVVWTMRRSYKRGERVVLAVRTVLDRCLLEIRVERNAGKYSRSWKTVRFRSIKFSADHLRDLLAGLTQAASFVSNYTADVASGRVKPPLPKPRVRVLHAPRPRWDDVDDFAPEQVS